MFEFEWDPAKAASNVRKHGVDFRVASTVFRDPLMRRVPDQSAELEERWVTLGEDVDGRLLVVCHTDLPSLGGEPTIRIISARPATPRERRQYESDK